MKNAISLAGILLYSITVLAQDDSIKACNRFHFDITGAIYSQQQSLKRGDNATDILNPTFLAIRRSQEPQLAATWGLNQKLTATDNPMGHGASFFRAHCWYMLTSDLRLYGSIEANNAGFSWGPYNTYNITFFPRYFVEYKKDFVWLRLPVSLKVKIGYFENYKEEEGLTIYNIDMQGVTGSLTYKKLSLCTSSVTDLQNTIGLNIDGTRTQTVALKKIRLYRHLLSDINGSHTKYLGPVAGASSASLSMAIYDRHMRVYGQLAYRFNDMFNASQNLAALAGINLHCSTKKLSYNISAEYRYYTIGFNYDFRKEANTHYRRTDRPVGSNFTGDQVYLVSYNNRPFSQWAVFTEYNAKQWVACYTARLNLEYPVKKALALFTDIDFNWIAAPGEVTFLYPFYKTGFKFVPLKGTYMTIAATNRTLNLDKHYTTYYVLKYPSLQAEFRRDLPYNH